MVDVSIEVVVGSPGDCVAAEQSGATRLELCAGIVAGGVTPSLGLFETCRAAASLPLVVMIRPREGGFFYSASEFEVMKRDVESFRRIGAEAIVFGILHAEGRIDTERTRELVELAGEMDVACHRAFDVTPDPKQALDDLAFCGVRRVLSSGQQRDLRQGLPLLRELFAHAAGRIEIQPCEHLRADNVVEVVQALRPRSVHLGPFVAAMDPTSQLGTPVSYGHHLILDFAEVAAVRAMIPPSA